MSVTAFTVLSEFRFDVANAVVGADALTNSVSRVSNAVDGAMSSVKNMGIGLAMQFTNAQAGIGGFIYSALNSSDKFMQSQLSFVQLIDSNMEHLEGTIGSMSDKMAVSRTIMKDIHNDAKIYGLSASELLEGTKAMTALLAPKGLAGENFGFARSMSRNLLKSAPMLGVHPTEVQGQMMRAVGDNSGGQASMGDTLFRRLIGEAPEPFKEAKVTDAKSFNALDMAKRVNLLNDAMGKFTKNSDILAMRANTLSGSMQKLKDQLTGPFSILKSIGDVLMPLLVEGLNLLSDWIQKDGAQIVEAISKVMKDLLKSPKEFFLNLMQLSSMSKDLDTSSGIVGLIVSLRHMREGLHLIGTLGPWGKKISDFLSNILESGLNIPIIGTGFNKLMSIFDIGPVVGFTGMMKAMLITIGKMAGVVAVLMIPLQGLTRAWARVKIENTQWLINNLAKITEHTAEFTRVLGILYLPIADLIKGWEELFFLFLGGTPLFDSARDGMEGLNKALLWFAEIILFAFSVVKAAISSVFDYIGTIITNIMTFFEALKNPNVFNVLSADQLIDNPWQSAIDGFISELDKSFSRSQLPLGGSEDGSEDGKVTVKKTDIHVTMNNNFKEVLQPDRIAFTIRNQLEKASENRTSSKGNTFASKAVKAV